MIRRLSGPIRKDAGSDTTETDCSYCSPSKAAVKWSVKHVVIAGSFFHVKAVHYKNQYKSTRVEAMLPKSHSGPDQFNSARVDICLFMEGKITGNMFDHSIQTDFVSVVSDPESFQIGSIQKVCWIVRSGKLPNRSDPGRYLTGKCCNLKSSCSAPGQWMVNVNKVKHSEECQHSLKFICDFIMFIEIALWYNCQVLADVGERISLFKIDLAHLLCHVLRCAWSNTSY